MKLQDYVNEMKPDFHRLYGENKYNFKLERLKEKFAEIGLPWNQNGVMKFLGIDLGILGKMNGIFGGIFR